MPTRIGIFFIFTICLVITLPAQQSATYKSELALLHQAKELYKNGQYEAARQQFNDLNQVQTSSTTKETVAYYLASIAIRQNQPSAEKQMQAFIEVYPAGVYKNEAINSTANYYFTYGKYPQAGRWYERVDVNSLDKTKRAEYNFNNGYINYQSNDNESAEDFFNKVPQNSPKYDQANYYKGYIAYENKDYDKANRIFEQVKQTPTQTDSKVAYAQSDMNFKQGNFEEAIRLGKQQLATANPKEASQLNKIIGECYFNLGQYEKAIPYLSAYKGYRGKWTNTDYYLLGYAYYKEGELSSAISEFNKIVGGEDEVAQNAYYHLAEAYLQDNKKQEALNAFKNASETDFSAQIKEDAYYNYAKLSYEIGNSYTSPPQVISSFLSTYPDHPKAEELKDLLIDSYITSKNYEAALDLLAQSTAQEDKKIFQEVAFLQGIEEYTNANYETATASFNKAIAQPVDKVIRLRSLYWKGQSEYELQQYQDALLTLKELDEDSDALKIPEYDLIKYDLGYSYFNLKQYAQSAPYFKAFAENDPQNTKKADALTRLGDAYFVTSSYWPAIEAYDQAVNAKGTERDYAAFQKALSYGFINRASTKIDELNAFLSGYPSSPYQDEALYELGNTYVAQNNNAKALLSYDQLIANYPRSEYKAKALLKQGLIYYNTDQSNEALQKFKRVAADFPSTSEASQAVQTARLIYIDLGKTDQYARWVKTLDYVDAKDADIENTVYASAEKKYQENNTNEAVRGFDNYLKQFPNGIYALKSHFYLGQVLVRDGNDTRAIPHFTYVLTKEQNEFTEPALAILSEVYLEQKKYAEAIPLLKRLETEASNATNKEFAATNLMKAYLETGAIDQASSYAKNVVKNNPTIQVKQDAQVILARSAMQQGDLNMAQQYYAEVATFAKGKLAAEALYHKVYFQHKEGKFKASNSTAQQLAADYSSYKEFAAKGLVVMAKNYDALGDAFQATYILESVIKNFSTFPAVVQNARQELNSIKDKEAKTNASIKE